MARTVDFYSNVLGFPLVKTVELPAGWGQHFFFDIGGGATLAFFWFPGSGALKRTRRYHNARRNPRFSLVFDDVIWEPYTIRGVKVTGSTEVRVADDALNLGATGAPLLVLRPERKWSWGIEEPAIDEAGTFSVRVDGGLATRLTTLPA
jgi:catechol 2,3-dioxygenase-like lactoylglutathione lyase family enzyme